MHLINDAVKDNVVIGINNLNKVLNLYRRRQQFLYSALRWLWAIKNCEIICNIWNIILYTLCSSVLVVMSYEAKHLNFTESEVRSKNLNYTRRIQIKTTLPFCFNSWFVRKKFENLTCAFSERLCFPSTSQKWLISRAILCIYYLNLNLQLDRNINSPQNACFRFSTFVI